MAKIVVDQIVDASPEQVWLSWDDFGNIARFHPGLKSSHLLADKPTGLGATRQCDMKDGKNFIRERIIGYAPNERMEIDIYEGTMPLKRAVATLTLSPAGAQKTRIQMNMEFTPKFGVLGLLMIPMMKPQFRKLLQALLSKNAEHVMRSAA
ncbi:MAG: SRPBCC family protein [Pseudomonadota bacterium]